MKSNHMGLAISFAIILLATSASTAEVALDYDVYKSRVEPIFLKKRPGHAGATFAIRKATMRSGCRSFRPGAVLGPRSNHSAIFR